MSKSITTTVQATLEVVFRKGTFGLFPTATFRSSLGTFACRDKWLETLEAGSYTGEFDIDKIILCHYKTQKYVPEFRVYNKVIIKSYRLDGMSETVESNEFDFLDDPILDEPAQSERPLTLTETESRLPDWISNDNSTDDECDALSFIRDMLQCAGSHGLWNMGEDIIIPAEIDRMDQRRIVKTLKNNGYRLVEPNKRLWSKKEEVEHA